MKLVFQWNDDPAIIKKKVPEKDFFYHFYLIQTIMGWQLEVYTPFEAIICYWGDYIMTDGHHNYYVFSPEKYRKYKEGQI